MAVNVKYTDMLKSRKVMVLPDVFPWTSTNVDPHQYIIDAIVKNVSIYTGSNIGSVELTFPKKVFGDLIDDHLPIKIAVDTMDNVIFRGFLVESTGVLNDTEDTVTARAMDYKWYFSKITRIRGKYFTTSGSVPNLYSSPNGSGSEKLKHEMFKGTLIADNGRAGYLQDEACIFNEGGKANCATNGRAGPLCVFKERKVWVENGVQYVTKVNFNAYYWTFSSALTHVVHWWIAIYSGAFSKVQIKSEAYARLSRLNSEESIPYDLSIHDNNPLEAIDKIVKAIPGKWIWWLEYSAGNIFINMKDINDGLETGKTLAIGSGKKMATDPVDVAGITVSRNTEESVKYVILKGGSLKLTTTVELKPLAEMHTVGGVVCPFTDLKDFIQWRTYTTGKSPVLDPITGKPNRKKDKGKNGYSSKYELPYRYYCIPVEGEMLKEALSAVSYGSVDGFTDVRYRRYYNSIESEFKKMFVNGLWVDRKFDKPCNAEFSKPIVFAYDIYHHMDKTTKTASSLGNGNLIFYQDSEYSFDGTTGLFIFANPQFCQFKNGNTKADKSSIESASGVESLEVTDRKGDDDFTGDHPLVSRRIFVTLSIKLDLPFVYGDNIPTAITQLSGSNFSRYIELNGQELEIHASNAFYPVQPNSTVALTGTGRQVVLARAGSTSDKFECVVNVADSDGGIYPSNCMTNYTKFPSNKDLIMVNKMDNYLSSINWYKENVSADLGVLNTSYKLADIITSIKNSETVHNNSGYFDMRDYVSAIVISMKGETEGYTTTLSLSNDINFTPTEFGRVMGNRIPTPRDISSSDLSSGIIKEGSV